MCEAMRLVLAVVTLWLICAVVFFVRYTRLTEDRFDAAAEGILEIETVTNWASEERPMEVKHYVLASEERCRFCEPFEGDEVDTYYVPSSCFLCVLDQEQNKFLNRLLYVKVTDADGKPRDCPEIMPAIFRQIENLRHDLFVIQIHQVGEEYFVYVELNVNLWDPCDLYYYNREKDQLIQLAEFDNQKVQKLHILSVDALHEV